MHGAHILQDARTAKVSEHQIQQSIVSGVLRDTGLPKISNIIHGPSKSHFGGHPMPGGKDAGAHPATMAAPKGSTPKTHQTPGMARYLASQKGSRRRD